MTPEFREGDRVWIVLAKWSHTPERGAHISHGVVFSAKVHALGRQAHYDVVLEKFVGPSSRRTVIPHVGVFHRALNTTRAQAAREAGILRMLGDAGVTAGPGGVIGPVRPVWCNVLRLLVVTLRRPKARNA